MDYNWAENILSHLLETEAGKLSVNEKVEENTKSVNDTSTDDKKICPKCKTDFSSDSKFCRKCGTKLSSPIPEPVPSNDAAEDHKQKQENQQLLELQRQGLH